MDRSIPEGVLTTSFGARGGVSWKKKKLKPPQTGGSPGDFFVNQDKSRYQDGSHKKKLGRDKSISEEIKGTSLGHGRGGSRKIKICNSPKLAEALAFFSPDKKTQASK